MCIVGILLPHRLRKVGVDDVGWSVECNYGNKKYQSFINIQRKKEIWEDRWTNSNNSIKIYTITIHLFAYKYYLKD